MSASRKHPLLLHLIVLAFAGVLPLVLLTGWGLVEVYRQQQEVAQRRAMEVTRATAVAVDSELQRSLSALKAMSAAGSLRAGDLEGFERTARRVIEQLPAWRNVILSDPVGRALVNTRVARGEPLPPINEMTSHRLAAERGMAVVGTLAKGNQGRYAFAARAPAFEGGQVRYVVSAVVDPGTIRDILVRQQLPRTWVISVFDDGGNRVARSRGHEEFLGLTASSSMQELIMLHGREGMGVTRVVEGGEAFTAYTTLPNGWVVATGIDISVVDAPARRTVKVYASAIALSLLVGLVAMLVVARRINGPMEKLREEARVLGEGGEPRPPRTSIREIAEVGDALVVAAARRGAYDRGKDQLLALLGHELRNPLAALSNAASLLQHANAQPGVAARAADVIQRQVAHLARLTDDLLDVARAMMGKVELRMERVDLAMLASEVMATLAATGRTREHVVEAHLQAAWIEGDAMRLDQVLSNLVVNATKYTPRGGHIVVRTGREGAESVLRVRDDGSGMTPEFAARAFDLFVQGDTAPEQAPGGLGIGLTLVRRLVELQGGAVSVHSDGPGRGTEFVVRFPSAAPSQEPRP